MMSEKKSKKVVLISEDEELYKSIRRALESVEGWIVSRFNEDSFKGKGSRILLAVNDDIQDWFYEKIRSKKSLNPVAVIGFKDKESFEKEFPLFHDHPYNHVYIRIPFNLSEFIDSLKNMIPISSHAIRKAICGNDTGYKGYLLKLLSHDLLKGRERCIEILNLVGNYLNDSEVAKEIQSAVRKIKADNNWTLIASEMGKRLEEILRGKGYA